MITREATCTNTLWYQSYWFQTRAKITQSAARTSSYHPGWITSDLHGLPQWNSSSTSSLPGSCFEFSSWSAPLGIPTPRCYQVTSIRSASSTTKRETLPWNWNSKGQHVCWGYVQVLTSCDACTGRYLSAICPNLKRILQINREKKIMRDLS